LLHAQLCELKEKLDIVNSEGTCQQLEQTNIFEKVLLSFSKISISNKPEPIL
jgi:hypothetical protein